MKKNPTMERIKNVSNWIFNECVEYTKWYLQQIINLKNALMVFVEKIIETGIRIIEIRDEIDDKLILFWEEKTIKEFLIDILLKIKLLFEKFKKICYNIYRKLKKN